MYTPSLQFPRSRYPSNKHRTRLLQVWSAAARTRATRTWEERPLWPSRLWIKVWSARPSSQSPLDLNRSAPLSRGMDMWVQISPIFSEWPVTFGQLVQVFFSAGFSSYKTFIQLCMFERCRKGFLQMNVVPLPGQDPEWCRWNSAGQCLWALHWAVGQVRTLFVKANCAAGSRVKAADESVLLTLWSRAKYLDSSHCCHLANVSSHKKYQS